METALKGSLKREAQISLTGTCMKSIEEICSSIQRCPEENPKDLLVRVTGRFYTHKIVGMHLINAVLHTARVQDHSSIKIVEPFCGDGRLICWLLEAASQRSWFQDRFWDIALWDCDSRMLGVAKENVLQTAAELNGHVKISINCGDSFQIARDHFGEFPICVTNPPWEVLKPDRRELKGLNKSDLDDYIQILRLRDDFLRQSYTRSVPLKKFSGWGTNLSRCGAEAALKLTTQDGVCGIVSPASLLADQMSEKLRRWIFEDHVVHDIAYYAAEAKLFEKVDQPSITIVASPGNRSEKPPKFSFFGRQRQKIELKLDELDWSHIEADKYIFPLQFGANLLKLNNRWRNLPCFGDLEQRNIGGLWAGRELDETDYKRFIGNDGDYLFVKGRMIKRFGIAEMPTEYVRPDGPKIPKSANYYRLAWRDVSRPNQKRRIYATIIPPGWVTGNSLSIAYYRDGNIKRLKALLAMVNSFVFEAQARMYLATAHISLGVVRRVHLPILSNQKIIEDLVELVDLCNEGNESALDAVEVQVAKLFGLTQEDFALLLSSFDKFNRHEIDALLSSPLWETDDNFKYFNANILSYEETP
ncbi:MAG: Alw26I/Eco31I/Esp3I family type II restriction adenine-specific DNA-methyltransferase [Methanothrix sp.]|nr:MAG: Alw26I/Eco31I/Esp3I family type II restriction adenine-specific DNA-methyltransferase [Methanothrix sp.]